MIFGIKILGLLVAMVAHQVIGGLWYSPLLFSKAWMKAVGKTPDDFKDKKGFVAGFVMSSLGGLVTAFAIAYLICILHIEHLWGAIALALLINLGFVSSNRLVHAPFEFKPLSLVLISQSFDFVTYTVMAIILFYLG